MNDPHSMIVGWPLDEIGPSLCEHYGLTYDAQWRHNDSKATWHLELNKHLAEHKGVDIFISFGESDWDEIKDGRYLLGVFYQFEGIEHTEEFHSLAPFLNYLETNNVKHPLAWNHFYDGSAGWGWAVDHPEWMEFLSR